MNTNWLTLSKERRIELLNQTTELTGLPAIAIEKDWAVTREDEHKIEPRQLIRAIPNKGFSCKQMLLMKIKYKLKRSCYTDSRWGTFKKDNS